MQAENVLLAASLSHNDVRPMARRDCLKIQDVLIGGTQMISWFGVAGPQHPVPELFASSNPHFVDCTP